MTGSGTRVESGRFLRYARKIVTGLVALFVFVLALQLLKASASALGPFVRSTLGVDDLAGALGFGWLAAYVMMGGSPVAAMSLTFFVSGVFTDVQTFLAITGSRFGASFVVLVIAFAYRLRGREHATGVQMGVLALLVTFSIYVPAAFIGYGILTMSGLDRLRLAPPGALVDVIDVVFDPLVTRADALLPPVGLFIAGAALLLGAFQLFDRALPDLSATRRPGRIERVIYRPLVMFGVGFVLTLFTMSVSVSLGVLVPLGAKGIARRENITPYILGANVSTFIDTLLASLLLDSPRAVTVVLAEILSVAAVSLLVLLFGYRSYERLLLAALDGVTRSTARFVTFLVVILLVPLLLLVL